MKPDDQHDVDARFLAALVAYDEALAAGREPEDLPPMPDSAGDTRLRRVQASLELLEQIWPRKSTPPIQPDETPSVPRNRGAENNGAQNNFGEEALFGLLEPAGDPPAHLNGQLNFASILRTRFQVQREIGSGGGGVVFLARDLRLGRQVALKMPRAEALFTPELRQRFHLEAQVAAGLDHPNIVPVFESGEIGPFCYIATAYCEGPDLRRWLRERQAREGSAECGIACSDTVHSLEVSPGAASETVPMTRGANTDARQVLVRAAAELVRTLANAVHYTHGRGILHRDLKPANILLVPKRSSAEPAQSPVDASRSQSGTPPPAFDLDCYTPRITDFGLARWEDGGQQRTKSGLLLGTPAYMAPEQAAGRIREIGTATDVYALGTILYEILTGRPPFEELSEADTLAKILSEEPMSPRRRRADVPADLNSICLRCLEKDPSQRYATAAALAEDLRRFLACEPTLARPLSAVQRARRFVRRKPAISALAAVSASAVVCLLGLGAWHLVELAHYNKSLVEMVARERKQTAQITRERDRASRSDNLARAHAYVGRIQLAEAYREDGHAKSMADLLQREWPTDGRQDLRGFEWHYLWRLCQSEPFPLREHAGHVYALGFSPDGKSLTSIGADETLRVWNIAGDCTVTSRRNVRRIHPEVAWSTNGRTLAYISDDHGKHILSAEDVVSGKKLGTWTVRPSPYLSAISGAAYVPISGNGRTLAYISEDDHGKHILSAEDVVSGKKLRTWTVRPTPYSLIISGDGRFLAASDVFPDRSEVHVWDVQTGGQVTRTIGVFHVTAVAFLDRDTRLAAAPSKFESYWSWPVEGSDAEIRTHELHDPPAPIGVPVFSPGGRSLAGIRDGGNMLVWDTATLKLRAELVRRGTDGEHPPQVSNLVFSPDGMAVAIGTIDGLEVWGLGPEETHARFEQPGLDVISVAFTADGNTIACGCRAGDIWLWRGWNGHRKPPTLAGHPAEAWCVAFSPDGRTLASGGDDYFVRIWDLPSGQDRRTLESHGSLVTALSWSKDARTLASSSFDGTVKLWDTTTWRERVTLFGHEGAVRACAISPDNKTVASAGDDRAVRLWNAATGELRFVLSGHTDKLLCLAFTPNGKTVATGGNDRTIRLWRTSDGQLLRTLREPNSVLSIAFSPDGRIMATTSKGGIVRLRNANSNRVVGTLKSHEQSVRSVIFSSDGKTLATAGEDHTVKLWNVATRQELLTLLEGEFQVNGLAFSRDGQSLAAAVHDGAIKLWTTQVDARNLGNESGKSQPEHTHHAKADLVASYQHTPSVLNRFVPNADNFPASPPVGAARREIAAGPADGSFMVRMPAIDSPGDAGIDTATPASEERAVDIPEPFGPVIPDRIMGHVVDAAENVHECGDTVGALAGTSAGGRDVFVRKLDFRGNEVWTRQFGTSGDDSADAIFMHDSCLYLAGHTLGTLDNQISAGGYDVFVRKLDSEGTEKWTRQFGAVSTDHPLGIAVNSSGVYVAGYLVISVPGGGQQNDGFVQKLVDRGDHATLEWNHQFGTPADERATGIAVGTDGSIYITGDTNQTPPDHIGKGWHETLVRKIIDRGDHVTIEWTDQFGASPDDFFSGIAVDAQGVYVATTTTGYSSTWRASLDGVVRKFGAAGGLIWTRQFGAGDFDVEPNIIAVDASSVYVVGRTQGTIELTGHGGPGRQSASGWDVFAMQLDAANGAHRWTRQFGTSLDETPSDISVAGSHVYISGHRTGNVLFDRRDPRGR